MKDKRGQGSRDFRAPPEKSGACIFSRGLLYFILRVGALLFLDARRRTLARRVGAYVSRNIFLFLV